MGRIVTADRPGLFAFASAPILPDVPLTFEEFGTEEAERLAPRQGLRKVR